MFSRVLRPLRVLRNSVAAPPSLSAAERQDCAQPESATQSTLAARRNLWRAALPLTLVAILGALLWGNLASRSAGIEARIPLRSAQSTLSSLAPAASTVKPFDGSISDCDVLVVGGTPAGIAAALAASRRGAKTLLIEERPLLGGDIVYAMLNMFDVPARPGEASPIHGIFAEFYDQLGMGFDIQRARRLIEDTVSIEPNLRAFGRTRVLTLLKDGERVTGATLNSDAMPKDRGHTVSFRVLIDATDDATIAARAGAGYYVGRENANPDRRMQSAGLLFSVAGVDWNRVRAYVRERRLIRAHERKNRKYAIDVAVAGGRWPVVSKSGQKLKHPSTRKTDHRPPATDHRLWLRLGGAHGNYAWERGDMVRDYKPRGRDILFMSINFGRQEDGTVVLNTLNLVGVDGLSEYSKKRARLQAMREIPLFLKYLRGRMPGFERATLATVAPELYIRETRHIHGFYALKVGDIRAHTKFFDRVGMASYPLDLHPYRKGDINPFGPQRYYYTIPLRALVPRRVNNLFVASRSLSATYSAAGSARVIPATMACGEAVGAAAWLCATRKLTPHDLMNDSRPVKQLQDNLREWGADIGDDMPRRK